MGRHTAYGVGVLLTMGHICYYEILALVHVPVHHALWRNQGWVRFFVEGFALQPGIIEHQLGVFGNWSR
jgi:hypothetical protein